MHCGYLCLLLLLWISLVAGRSIRKQDTEMQSIIESLLTVLNKYREEIANTPNLQGMPDFPCTESFTDTGKEAAYQRLSQYQTRLEELQTLLSRDSLVDAATLNQDLLPHLKDDHVPHLLLPLPASSNTFHEIRILIETVSCWTKQVEKLKRV